MRPQGLLGDLFRQVVTHPVAVGMIFIAALVFGFVSYQRLAVELMPDISYPTVTVRTAYEGAAPGEVESQISRPVEEALATLDGLVKLESRSRAGSSDVVLGFDWDTDMSAAVQTVRENLQTTFLPQGAERPLILRYDPSLDPFLRIALSLDPDDPPTDGEKALYTLRELADDEVKRELEAMAGVAAVRVRGGLEREIRVEVREDWLVARRVTLDQVRAALQSENINLAGGSILEGDTEYLVRTLNEYRSLAELQNLEIRRSDGVRVKLSEVALVRETHREREVVSHLDGVEAVELEVFKEADANVVDVAARVKEALYGDGVPEMWGGTPGLANTLPDGVVLQVLDDQAAFIESAILNLRDTAVLGGLLAVVVLFLFLRDFRATAIIGLAIPVSIVIGFAPLYLRDVTLNLMSLGGLALGIGMLVDNAVVVLESIQRYREDGAERVDAAIDGATSVAAAVTASTLTTVAVFFPIAFVEGVAGQLFGDLAVAVVSSLMASLAVALFLVPMLAALALPDASTMGGLLGGLSSGEQPSVQLIVNRIVAGPRDELLGSLAWQRGAAWRRIVWPYALVRLVASVLVNATVVAALLVSAGVAWGMLRVGAVFVAPAAWLALKAADRFQATYDRFAGRYARLLAASLARRGGVLTGAFLVFVVSLVAARSLGSELIPQVHQGRFTIEAALPVGTPLGRTLEVMEEVERVVRTHPEVASVYTQVGADTRADTSADEGDHSARLRVQLAGTGRLAEREARVMDELRVALAEVPRLQVKMSRPALFSFQTPVEVIVFGYDLGELRKAGDAVRTRLAGVEGLRDVRSSLVKGHPEVLVRYDRARLQRFGLDTQTVAQRVRDKVQGVAPTEIRRGDRRVELRVQLSEADRSTLADLRAINVNPNLDPPIPLDAVADLEEVEGPSEIRRVDQQRAVVVSANLEGFDLGSAGRGIASELEGVPLPPGLTWRIAGQSTEMEASLGSLRFALLLAVFLVYVIMASTFEHLLHPFVILFSVPLALVGVVAALWPLGVPLSVVVFIGLIVLAGVVVNNAIVLVDTVNRLRDDGRSTEAALREGAAMRLRPILITTATTVLGLLPLSLGFGAGAEVQQPLALTVIGGLLSSTLLTLVVIPSGYGLLALEGRRAAEPMPEGAEGVG